MRAFTDLYLALDASTKTNAKIAALVAYYRAAEPLDAAWATFFLTGRKFRRLVKSADLRVVAMTASGLPEWLFEASYDAVGDLAETIALVLPPPSAAAHGTLSDWIEQRLSALAGLAPADAQARLIDAWSALDRDQRFVFGKLLTGEFRVGAARQLVYRALADVVDVPVGDIAQRLVGPWTPSRQFWSLLRGTEETRGSTTGLHRPYPFFLAHPLEAEPSTLGARDAWQAEWKWDGIRAQLLVRDDGASLWSRGEELVSEQFPEILEAARRVSPGTVLDGEIVAWDERRHRVAPFASLQRRLNRKAPGATILRDVPVAFIAYDLLEHDARDVRGEPLAWRREQLESSVPHDATLRRSPLLDAPSWQALHTARARAREEHAEGVMLKRCDSAYGVGRPRGAWWKWKVDPYTVDAVLVYAQPGHGRRASLFTDYTFAVWDEGTLVPFAKAYSGLTDAELRRMDQWIRSHTLERFGPVRAVEPVQVFELAFEGIQRSSRHRSGIAVRFPRIARWRQDKPAVEADTLATLRKLASPPPATREA